MTVADKRLFEALLRQNLAAFTERCFTDKVMRVSACAPASNLMLLPHSAP